MPHASTWLEYSWNLADLVVYRLDGTGESREVQIQARSSRRDKFRLNPGASRDELLWSEILGILRKVSKLPPLPHPSQDPVTGSTSSKVSAPFKGVTPCSETAHNEDSSGEAKLNHLLEEVYWPVEQIGDIASMHHIEILWDHIPASADPVVGGGYKTEHTRGTGRLEVCERKKMSSGSKTMNRSLGHCEHGDSLGRGERKRWQVEKIAAALNSLDLKPGASVVDFGCGSGALTLPLAAIFPEFTFIGVDFKLRSIILLEERARKGSLHNVKAVYGRIENYSAPFDACVALHACGIATDLALLQAMKNRAAYVMSPCCIGKLQIPVEWTLNSTDSGFSLRKSHSCNHFQEVEARSRCGIVCASNFLEKISQNSLGTFDVMVQIQTPLISDIREPQDCSQFCLERLQESVSSSLYYPRSSWLRNCISEKEFQVLARAADWSSYDFESMSSQLHSLCKVVLELDRNEASREVGYWTGLYTLANEKAGTVGVSHVLVGKPV